MTPKFVKKDSSDSKGKKKFANPTKMMLKILKEIVLKLFYEIKLAPTSPWNESKHLYSRLQAYN